MKNQRHRILLATMVGTLALGAWNSTEPSWAIDLLGQIKDVGTSVTSGATEGVIKQLKEARDKAKAELKAKLEKEMRAQLDNGFKMLDDACEKKIKELGG